MKGRNFLFGMAEEVIPFVVIFIPLARRLGYDSIVGVSIPFLGAAVSVLAEMTPDPTRTPTGRILEMHGSATAGTDYSSLQHLVIIPHTKAGLPRPKSKAKLLAQFIIHVIVRLG